MRISPNLSLVASLQFGLGSRYDCHVYAIHTTGGVILIDSGAGAATSALLNQVHTEFPGAALEAIILTHSHPDHACGAAQISLETGCPVYCPLESVQTV